jgi:hypothetical protein
LLLLLLIDAVPCASPAAAPPAVFYRVGGLYWPTEVGRLTLPNRTLVISFEPQVTLNLTVGEVRFYIGVNVNHLSVYLPKDNATEVRVLDSLTKMGQIPVVYSSFCEVQGSTLRILNVTVGYGVGYA